MTTRTAGSAGSARLVLDVDPDLGAGIPPEEWDQACDACRARIVRQQPGTYHFPNGDAGGDGNLACLIVAGLVCRQLILRDRYMLELLGPGDVVQKPVADATEGLDAHTTMTAAAHTEMLILGPSFIRAAARWPTLMTALLARLEAQRERLAIQGLIAHFPRAEHRLLLALWQLAASWGRETPEGRLLPLPLTHGVLGQMTAARRSTVTLAVSALEGDGLIRRLEDGAWLITAAGAKLIRGTAGSGKAAQPLGGNLMLRLRAADATADSQALRAQAKQLLAQPRPKRRTA